MSDESKPTLGAIYAAWRAVGADVAGLDWAKFVGHIAAQAPAEGDATLTEEQIDRFIPERIGVRNWGKPEQADLFNRGQVRDAIRTAIASQPNVQPKAAEVDAAPWSKTVESAALLLQRCTGLELQDCDNLAGTILGMAANVQPKGTQPVAEVRATGANSCELFFLPVGVELKPGDKLYACPVQAPAPAPEMPVEHLPTKEHIRELAQEALDQIMEQAQVFASAWSLVGGRFDTGNAMSDAEDAKAELRTMVRSLADLAAETVRPVQAPAVEAEKLLRDTLRDAEWCEKRVHVCDGPVLQHWKLEVYLPIVAGSGMSAEQALDSALGKSHVPVQHTASQQGEN